MAEIGDPDGYGRYGMLDMGEDGRLLCHECGLWRDQLATHARLAHHVTAADYRQAHGLSPAARLVGRQVQERLSEVWQEHREDHLRRLDASRDPRRAFEASPVAAGAGHVRLDPHTRHVRQETGRARRGRPLTPDELALLGDGTDIAAWAAAARRLMQTPGITLASIARSVGIPKGTAISRVWRFRDS